MELKFEQFFQEFSLLKLKRKAFIPKDSHKMMN